MTMGMLINGNRHGQKMGIPLTSIVDHKFRRGLKVNNGETDRLAVLIDVDNAMAGVINERQKWPQRGILQNSVEFFSPRPIIHYQQPR